MAHFSSLILCGTPRSGSTLLCDLLEDTMLLGRPSSFFRRESIRGWSEQLGLGAIDSFGNNERDKEYLAAIIAEGTGDSSVFSCRIMWESMVDLSTMLSWLYPGCTSDAERFECAFGSPFYLHLAREDKVAQAVSRVKAMQTGLWHLDADGAERERMAEPQAPIYDGAMIEHYVRQLIAHEKAWQNWFNRNGVEPLSIMHEDLIVNPQRTLKNILVAMGSNTSVADGLVPRTRKMADAISQEWVNRYRSEQGCS